MRAGYNLVAIHHVLAVPKFSLVIQSAFQGVRCLGTYASFAGLACLTIGTEYAVL